MAFRGNVNRLLSQFFGLALADAEKLRAADRANALGRRPLVLQSNCFRVLNLSLGPALHTICLHLRTSSGTLAQQSSKPEPICQ
jgi:hypothetical protein